MDKIFNNYKTNAIKVTTKNMLIPKVMTKNMLTPCKHAK